ncbi:hypothetical protein NDI85_19845 [Halomicroarcula sp. S1AR25-4]|uniref:helix-turn-helix domain-containing protein n=1 Tax=Haloarcula sp. S1AR25-4 TaxID=2950538 RepID=UPI0028763011|nr:hypothetical protein [Halomicroarcula sp. S1AR25-4]MDS0280041.1 hypothetical protein [Halomicroarcula sp. S1AR25-4]
MTENVVETLTALEPGDHADLVLANGGDVSAHVVGVETEQDGLAGCAYERLTLCTTEERTLTIRLAHETRGDDVTSDIEYAAVADGDTKRFITIEEASDGAQQTLATDGGDADDTDRDDPPACPVCARPMEYCEPPHAVPHYICPNIHDPIGIVQLPRQVDYAFACIQTDVKDSFDSAGVDPFAGVEAPADVPGLVVDGMLDRFEACLAHKRDRQRTVEESVAGGEPEQATLKAMADGGTPDPDAFRIPTIAELDAMRAAANLSMADLSECAGFTDNRFSHILTNDVNPQTRTIRAFLTALQEFDGHTESGDQGPAPDTSDLVDDDGPTAVDVEQIAARLDRLNADDVGEDPTPPDGDETMLTDGGHAVRRGQTWTCNEAHADAADVPPAHDTVSLWPDYPRFAAVVDRVEGDVAQLTAGTSNSHPRAPDLGDTVDIHVDRLHGQARWSLTSAASTTEDPPLVTDGGRVEDDVVHDLTNRPVGDLSQAALKAEWSEAYERLASGTVEDRDGTWDRRRDLWQEMRERTNADPPECPECGATSWSQEFGGPKHCNGCGWAPTDEDMELIQRIDSYWSSVKAVDYGGAE